MTSSQISPVVLTYNEEANLARVLGRLAWAAEVVVLDSFSTDRTVEIARTFPNVRVVQRRFDNHMNQWNHGLACAATPWVLSLDADYVLSEEIVDSIRSCGLSLDAYSASFTYCVNGKPLRGSLYPPRVVLFRKDRARYVADGHTQRICVDGAVGALSGFILHDDRKPLGHWLEAQARYAALECAKLIESPRSALRRSDRVRRWKWIAPLLMPWYCLFGKGLVLDGRAGAFYAFQRTYFELVLALKLLERDLAADGSSLPLPRSTHDDAG